MKMRILRRAAALVGMTAGVALLVGIGGPTAQAAPRGPGGGSFPNSFLIPGTNTSISIFGTVIMKVSDEFGSPYMSDTGPSGASTTAFTIGGIPLEGPGSGGGQSVDNQERAIHGGLRWSAKYSGIFFETRTPTDLGEVKTVILTNFSKMTNQGTYIGRTTQTNEPQVGAGNNEIPRLEFAYGTLGPWLMGQYNSAWSDPIMRNPIGDVASQVGPLQTANIRRPQIRYTYLMGNGLSASVSLEANTYANEVCTGFGGTIPSSFTNCAGGVVPQNEDSTDVGGITNYPSVNAGIAWDQPWGHAMARVGFAEDEIRNVQTLTGRSNLRTIGTSSGTNKRIPGYAVEGGVMLNTWGHDQWRGLIVYSHAAATYLTDMHSNAYLDPVTGSLDAISELALNTSYIHRFNRNWSVRADFGIGFFTKPGNTAGLTNTASGSNNAQLASFEKRHLNSALELAYMPVPGKVLIPIEWDHYDRWVQASNTWGQSNKYSISFIFFW